MFILIAVLSRSCTFLNPKMRVVTNNYVQNFWGENWKSMVILFGGGWVILPFYAFKKKQTKKKHFYLKKTEYISGKF